MADFDLIETKKSACELQDKALDRFPSCSSEVNLYAGMADAVPLQQLLVQFWRTAGATGEKLIYACVWIWEGAVSRAIVSWSFGNRISRGETFFRLGNCSWCSHLAGRDELQRAQSDLEIGSVGLEVEESLSNVLLELGGVLPRRAVGSDLVQGLAHLGG